MDRTPQNGTERRVLERRDAVLGWMACVQAALSSATDEGARERLREEALRLVRALKDYLTVEDEELAPLLRDGDAWGRERLACLEDEHHRERTLLVEAEARLGDLTHVDEVERVLADLLDALRACFAEEDEVVLSSPALSGTTVTDAFGG